MNNYLYGTRQIISKKPIRTVDDLAGLKIRVPNNVMQIKAIQRWGNTNSHAIRRSLSRINPGRY